MNVLDTIGYVLAFVFGSMVGSFLNVCIYRLPRGESVIVPRSRCPKCGAHIAWYDNIPMVSWLLLLARCRHCKEPISWLYPLVEMLTAGLFLLLFWRFHYTFATPIYMALTAGLVLITFVDLADWTIPDEVTLPGIPLGLGCAVFTTWYEKSGLRVLGGEVPVFSALIGALLGGGILYLLDKLSLVFLKKRGMGFGDVKLAAMLGAFLGWVGVILVIMIASIVGSLVGMIALQILKAKGKVATQPKDKESITLAGHYLPFGPYLCFAGIVVMLAGQEIYTSYLAFVNLGR